MDPTGRKGTRPDIFDRIWSKPGKVHKTRLAGIVQHMDIDTSLEAIWAMVELSGITDESDQLRTFEELKELRREMRQWYLNLVAAGIFIQT